jgi:hypothetical protein
MSTSAMAANDPATSSRLTSPQVSHGEGGLATGAARLARLSYQSRLSHPSPRRLAVRWVCPSGDIYGCSPGQAPYSRTLSAPTWSRISVLS